MAPFHGNMTPVFGGFFGKAHGGWAPSPTVLPGESWGGSATAGRKGTVFREIPAGVKLLPGNRAASGFLPPRRIFELLVT